MPTTISEQVSRLAETTAAQPPNGASLHQHFQGSYEQGALITPGQSARSLVARMAGDASGQIWNATDA